MSRKKCPRCGRAMSLSGELKLGLRGGRRKVRICRFCGYRTIS